MIRDGMKQMDLETQRDMEQYLRDVEKVWGVGKPGA